jgi:hypothetical protein
VTLSLPFDKLRIDGNKVLTILAVFCFCARRAQKQNTEES